MAIMSMDFSHPNAQPFELEAGDCAVLLIHGFTGSPGHMRYVGNAMHAAGFSVRGLCLPGHCTSLDDMAKSAGPQWLAACEAACREMTDKYRRVSVGGLSLGGVLALRLAQRLEPACVLLYAAAIRYKKASNRLSPAAKHFVRTIEWGGRKLDPETFLYEYDFGYTGGPVAKVEDMTRLQRDARAHLAEIACPAIAFQSHLDDSVHRTGPDIIMRGISSPVKEIQWVDRSPHVLTLGPDRDYVCDRSIDFLRRYGV